SAIVCAPACMGTARTLPRVVLPRRRDLAQRALEHLRRRPAADQVLALDDDCRHAADAEALEELLGGAHLVGEFARGQDRLRTLTVQPGARGDLHQRRVVADIATLAEVGYQQRALQRQLAAGTLAFRPVQQAMRVE